MRVFWAALMERSIQEYAVNSLLDVAMQCGAQENYVRLKLPYTQTATARNTLIESFLENSDNPNDALVMLDCDHIHPIDVVPRLIANNVGVVGALYYRRSVPHDPLMFLRGQDGQLRSIVNWTENKTLIPCQMVATGAIAIRRGVFDDLKAKGFDAPYFRYEYNEKGDQISEDMYFGKVCELAGITHFCDVTLQIPHLTTATVERHSWDQWAKDHADQVVDAKSV